jgi:uncharacterized glyoxalase superfamily protein PhnB
LVTFVAGDSESGSAFREELQAAHRGVGVATHIKVDDIDETYRSVPAAGMNPVGEPEKRASGTREFALRDPDGYKLLFFCEK